MNPAFSVFAAARGDYPQRPGQSNCDQHGLFVVREFLGADGGVIGTIPVKCPACAQDEREAEEKNRLEEQASRRFEAAITAARIPKRHQSCTLENYRNSSGVESAMKAVLDYAQRWPKQLDTGECLILLGEVGTGKTHLACGLIRKITERGGRCLYTTVQSMIRDIRDTWSKGSDRREHDVVRVYSTVPLLVLDEVGATLGTETERSQLFDLLDSRYQDLLPTVVLGNVSAQELESALDARSVDRLREGGGRAYKLSGKSQRAISEK